MVHIYKDMSISKCSSLSLLYYYCYYDFVLKIKPSNMFGNLWGIFNMMHTSRKRRYMICEDLSPKG